MPNSMSSKHSLEEQTNKTTCDNEKQTLPCSPIIQVEDYEIHEKKDRPPRFSQLFDVPTKLPASLPREFDSYPPPKRKSGVFIPTPLFVIFAVLFLFESTVLFAYTVIGLYNNLPSRLVPMEGRMVATGCDCASGLDKGSINIAPNFIMPQAPQAVITQTVTVLADGTLPDNVSTTASTSVNSSTVSPTSISSSTSSSSAAASQAAAAVESLLLGLQTSSTSVSSTTTAAISTSFVTATPTRSVVDVTSLLTVDSDGQTVSARPTVTSTQVLSGSAASAFLSSSAAAAAASSNIEAALASIAEATKVNSIPTETAISSTTVSSTSTTPVVSTSSSTTVGMNNKLCIIGPGGMMPAGCFGSPAQTVSSK